MGPRANFNLVSLPTESDSLVTQVDIWGVRCAEGGARAKFSAPFRGIVVGGEVELLGKRGGYLEEGTGRETDRKRKRDSREETQKHKTEQNPEEHKTQRKRREQEADQEEVEEAAEEEEEEEEEGEAKAEEEESGGGEEEEQ